MKIGLLVPSIGDFGKKGFYNAQEIGLGKALSQYFDVVQIYRLVSEKAPQADEDVEGNKNIALHFVPSRSFGTNGLVDLAVIDTSIDCLICFSDTQISVPKVYKWAVRNKIKFYPYIGVLESHSTSKLKKLLMDMLFKRNLKIYQKCHCFVKTPTVAKKLRAMGVKDISVMPVGLDIDLLHQDYESADRAELKAKYGFLKSDKVLLFIGRLIDEKQPARMIEILNQIREQDESYKLLMVGSGLLKDAVNEKIKLYGLADVVKQIDKISNSDIWELYRFADCFVNLNQQEIFGMALLEAMYYGCKVVAWRAPGPELIIENGKSGYLAESDEEVLTAIIDEKEISEEAHQRIKDRFLWDITAKRIVSVIGE